MLLIDTCMVCLPASQVEMLTINDSLNPITYVLAFFVIWLLLLSLIIIIEKRLEKKIFELH